jgi:hypothetical protein
MKKISFLIFFLLLLSASAFSATYYTDITLNSTADNSGTYYRPHFGFNHSGKVAEGKSVADGSDLYVTDNTGAVYYEFCIEYATNNTSNMTVWVNMEDNSMPDKATLSNLRLYYSDTDPSLHAENCSAVWDTGNHSARWGFGEASGTRYDSTDNSNDATAVHSPVQASGRFGYGQDLESGDNDYFTVADADSLSFGDGLSDEPFSIMVWTNWESDASKFGFLMKRQGTDKEYQFQWSYTVGEARLLVVGDSNYVGREGSDAPTIGSWMLYSYTYDGGGTSAGNKFYVNKDREDDTNYEGLPYVAMENTNAIVYIGVFAWDLTSTFDGIFDEIRIIRKELTADEIAGIYGQTYEIGAEHGGGTPNVTDSINITLHIPLDASSSYNKSTNFTYQVDTRKNATCNFYRNGINEYNDTFQQGYTNASRIISQTYGLHNWSVYCEQDANATINDTSATRTVTIMFSNSLVSPANNITISGNSTIFTYHTTNLYDIDCNLSLDGAVIDSQTISGTGNTQVSKSGISDGSHVWGVICSGGDNPSYTVSAGTRTIHLNFASLDEEAELSPTPQNVFNTPQALFYDVTEALNVLYFTDDATGNHVRIYTIINNTVNESYSHALNRTKDFTLALREEGYTSVLMFNTDNTSLHFANFSSGILNITNTTTPYNPLPSSFLDPYTYAYTKQHETINYTSESYYAVILPNATTSTLVKKYMGNMTFYTVATANDNPTIRWQTIANNSNLTQWLYVFPKNNGPYNRLALYSYNGESSTEVKELSTDQYTVANLENLTVLFEEYDGYTYIIVSNATDRLGQTEDRIYLIEEDVTYKFNEHITNPSHFFFITKETFIFFNNDGSDISAYSCYFNGMGIECNKFPSSDYGYYVPYERGTMTSAKRNGTSDVVVKGQISVTDKVSLFYNQHTYDGKFICYDEMDEWQKQFNIKIYSDTQAIIFKNTTWGYVIPSEHLGTGTKKAYTQGTNGSVRLYIIGLDNDWFLDIYSLPLPDGQYYTFHVVDQYNADVPDAVVTAYRYSTEKGAWVIIEQGITNFGGETVLFLETYEQYKIMVEADGYVILNFDYTPTATTDLEIQLTSTSGAQMRLPDYEYIWNDISFSLTPTEYMHANDTNITFTIVSAGGNLQYYGMWVKRDFNNTEAVVCNTTINTQPYGGTINCTTNGTGRYLIKTWFKHQNYTLYDPMDTIIVGSSQGLFEVVEMFEDNDLISGIGYMLIAIFVAFMVGAYVSQYSMYGAGAVGLAVLWFFTFLNPDVMVVQVLGDHALTPVHITSLTTIGVLAGFYLKSG